MAQYLTNNQEVNLYEGGFRYSPVLHSTDGINNNKIYSLNIPIEVYSTTNIPAYTYLSPSDNGPGSHTLTFSSKKYFFIF